MAVQTDYHLPDSPYEEPESSMETLDESLDLGNSSDDGFWSDKAYSI